MHLFRLLFAFGACFLFQLAVGPVHAENWPQWRGPTNNGLSRETGLPTKWSPTENVKWRLPLPGPGGSTPVIWEDQIFVTSVEGDDLVLSCVTTSGEQAWKKVVSHGNKIVRRDEGNSASNSPCTDGQHVWCMFTNGALACYTMAGEQVWQVDLQERFGQFDIAFGMTSTPVLDGDRLFLQLIHGDGNARTREATVAALDKRTGNTLWRVPRPSEAYNENEHAYSSPILYRDGQQAFFLSHGADYIVAHDLDSGRELWRCGGFHPDAGYDPTLRFVSSPVAVAGLIVAPSAKKGKTFALKPGGQGDISEADQYHVWHFDITPDVPSPLVVDQIVYLCRQNGNLVALDRATGKQHYEERTQRDRHRASPVYADGKIYLTARDGTISVCRHGTEFKLLASNKMEEDISASPAIADGHLYLRTFKALYCIQ